MKVNVVSRKLIKPCTPTPENLKTHKLSFIDELMLPVNVRLILIYPTSNPKQISHLEESLSKILPKFYPLAGRYVKNDHIVDCNDQGVEFVMAEAVEANLVAKTGTDELNDLLPRDLYQVDHESTTDPLMSVQITEFKNCGGVAIGISIWHKILDAFSVGKFISAWSGNSGLIPAFDLSELFPFDQGVFDEIHRLTAAAVAQHVNNRPSHNVLKRFLFNKEAIITVRSTLSSPNYSRVRVVSAVVAKALIGADRTRHGRSRATLIAQAINMRGRLMVPSPLDHSCGNLSVVAYTRCISAAETENITIQQLVDLLGDSIEKKVADCAKMLSPGVDKYGMINGQNIDTMKELAGGDKNLILFSDWSKFGFYDADFGQGKPVEIGPMPLENATLLTNDKEGNGIEAWVNVDRDDMAYFEQEEEIKKLFTT